MVESDSPKACVPTVARLALDLPRTLYVLVLVVAGLSKYVKTMVPAFVAVVFVLKFDDAV